jgi:hypothetical protein
MWRSVLAFALFAAVDPVRCHHPSHDRPPTADATARRQQNTAGIFAMVGTSLVAHGMGVV